MWAEYGGRRDKAGRQRTGRGVELAAEEVSRTELQLKEQALRVQEATTTSARSESAARKEGLAFMREQLANAQAREQAGLSQAQRIGRMTIMDRQRGSQAANMVLKHGIDKVSPQIVDTAERYAPGFIAKLSQDRADSLPEVIKDKKSGILDDVDFRQARAGQSKLRADIKVNVVLDEQALADKIVEALKKGFGDVIASVENRQKADEIKRRAGEQVRNNDANR